MEIVLLSPQPPLLFMGEEFAASAPFLYFCDYHGDLAAAVTEGRRNEFARFAKFSSPELRESIPDPNSEITYSKSKLNWQDLQDKIHGDWLDLYRHLLGLRRDKVVPHLRGGSRTQCAVSKAGKRDLCVDWIFEAGARLQLRANLGDEPVSGTGEPPATPFYTSSREVAADYGQGLLRPWSVVWSLLR